tara:strand:- start:378 stop:1757 length:1380 start_codon:yes stop_codon:yes gene_type:complete
MSNVVDYGTTGDGVTDDTEAILHTLEAGDGTLQFPAGNYLITRTIPIQLDQISRFSIDGCGGSAKILMAGEGPAFHLIGTHQQSADPASFNTDVWANQRMPTIQHLEIEGTHPDADGFWIEGTMQSTLVGILLRKLRNGIHIRQHARNILISHCHIYHNRGVGVFLDSVNLHQTIIANSHISYCSQGGIKVINSEIRNLHITGNDIEYNYDAKADISADIWIDSSQDNSSVREGSIVSNTIQANYSPNGANILMIGHHPEKNQKAGMFTISGNLIGNQETNINLIACRGVVVSGNVIYSGHHHNLQVNGSRNIVIGQNTFDHNPDYEPNQLCTGIRLIDSHNCTFNGSVIQDCQSGQHTVPESKPITKNGLLEIINCQRITVNGCQILDGYPNGIYIERSKDIIVCSCNILDTRPEPKTEFSVQWTGPGSGNLLTNNRLQTQVKIDLNSGVLQTNNAFG